MKLVDFLSPQSITTELKAQNKKETLQELCQMLGAAGKLPDAGKMVETLMERESLGSTGIGQGIAIPHAKTNMVTEQIAAIAVSRKGIDFDALDGEPVYIIFLLVAPAEAAGNHLKALAKVSRLLKDKFFRQSLRDAKSAEDILRIIQQEDEY